MNFPSLGTHRAQLIISALTASLCTAALFGAYDKWKKYERRRLLDEDILRSIAASDWRKESPTKEQATHQQPVNDVKKDEAYDEDLIREQLARNYAFFGEEGMSKLRRGSVVVVGCGGVGSWAAVMLVRSGVSKIRLVDFDYVTLSSLNRHATAGLSDISKWVEIDSRIEIWRKEDGGALLEGVDWVIDAIDNITTKVDLLKYCHDHNLKVFSSMGAGAKCDPTRIQISDISYTIYDPLARAVRRRLRLQGVSSGIPVVYSTEVPGDVKLLPLPEEEFQKGNVKELGVFDDFRVRILPVLGPLPSIFGLHIATYIVCELAGKPITNPLPIKNRKKLYERLLRDLLNRESKRTAQAINKLPIDEDDVALIFEDLYRGRSVFPPHPVPSRPTLIQWDFRQSLTVENCVVMEYAEAERHTTVCWGPNERGSKTPEEAWGEEVASIVRSRVKEIAKRQEWLM